MTFGEKIKEARLAMNLSQTELAQMTGISERSLYTYEQLGTLPRKSNIRKLAEALHISVSYLLDESETDSQSHIDQDMFILEAKENFGSKGAKRSSGSVGSCKFSVCRWRIGRGRKRCILPGDYVSLYGL